MTMTEFIARLEARDLPPDAVALTFDDGYRDNLTNAKPLLIEHEVPASILIATGYVGQTGEFWWDELARLILNRREGAKSKVRLGKDWIEVKFGPITDGMAMDPWQYGDQINSARAKTYFNLWSKLRDLDSVRREVTMAMVREILGADAAPSEGGPLGESDLSKLVVAIPDSVILTSVEFDHADIYKDLDAVETAFKRLVNLVPGRGRIVALDTGESVERCVARAFCPVERYGTGKGAMWQITKLRLDTSRTSWSVLRNGEPWADFEFSLAGEYNVLNATAAAALASGCGISREAIASALQSFKSVKRRLEVRAQVNGITIIDDFAHHPTAIAGTLKALRSRYPGARLWVILEPRSNTLRRNVLQHELARSLAAADEIVVANVFRSESIPENERMNVAALAAEVQKQGRRARIVPDADEIVQIVAPEMRPGDVVAILSNGGFGGIYEKLPQRLKSISGGAPGQHPLKASAKA